jgi:hypothetical protein
MKAEVRCSNRRTVGGCSFCSARLDADPEERIAEVILPGRLVLRVCQEHLHPFVRVMHEIEFDLEECMIEMEQCDDRSA